MLLNIALGLVIFIVFCVLVVALFSRKKPAPGVEVNAPFDFSQVTNNVHVAPQPVMSFRKQALAEASSVVDAWYHQVKEEEHRDEVLADLEAKIKKYRTKV